VRLRIARCEARSLWQEGVNVPGDGAHQMGFLRVMEAAGYIRAM
jgi:hypothetical protein